MARLLYMFLLRLHPHAFRERFGDEMLGIFRRGRSEGVTRRAAVGCLGIFAAASFAATSAAWGRPSRSRWFRSIDVPHIPNSLPRRSALAQGALLPTLLLGVVTFAMSRGGGPSAQFLIGAKYPRQTVDRSSIAESEPTTQISVRSKEIAPIYQLADSYFKIMPVLRVLDANGDRDVSTWEMVTAVSPLRRLDANGDGKLDAVECGFFLGKEVTVEPRLQVIARRQFMASSPLLAVLDEDANGAISAEEIERGPTALKTLDLNRDGVLTPAEVLPASALGRLYNQ